MKQYRYFVFFSFHDSGKGITGYGNCEIERKFPILSIRDLHDVRDEISRNNDNRDVLIHNFQLFGDGE